MPFPTRPGKSGNPAGISKYQKRTLRKMYIAIDKAIDGLGVRAKTEGTTRMAELITDAMEDDIIGTLHKLGPYMPKSINIDVDVRKEAHQLSDDELEAIVMRRREMASKEIEGEIIEADTPQDEDTLYTEDPSKEEQAS